MPAARIAAAAAVWALLAVRATAISSRPSDLRLGGAHLRGFGPNLTAGHPGLPGAVSFPQWLRNFYKPLGFGPQPGNYPIGFLTNLSVGGAVLEPDLSLYNPLTKAMFPGVAVLSHYQWEIAGEDVQEMAGVISPKNADAIGRVMNRSRDQDETIQVIFAVRIFEFDKEAKAYYVSLDWAVTPLVNGTISVRKNGTSSDLSIGAFDTEVQSPKVRDFEIKIQPLTQVQYLATSPAASVKLSRQQWGPWKPTTTTTTVLTTTRTTTTTTTTTGTTTKRPTIQQEMVKTMQDMKKAGVPGNIVWR